MKGAHDVVASGSLGGEQDGSDGRGSEERTPRGGEMVAPQPQRGLHRGRYGHGFQERAS